MELININEANFEYGTDLLLCFAAGKAPKSVYVCTSNIKRGDNWNPGEPEPPNGIYRLSKAIGDWWEGFSGLFAFLYRLDAGQSSLEIFVAPPAKVFENFPNVECKINFMNELAVPAGNKYYNGEAVVAWVEPDGDNALSPFIDSIIDPPDGLTDVLVYPVAPTAQVVNILRGVHQTKILVKRDFP